jgi:hypothetical protein
MKKKKFISTVLVIVFVLSFAPATSAYIVITPFYLYTGAVTNSLIITNNTASCHSVITGLSSITRIEATQYLQRWNGSRWVNVENAVWSDSVNGRRLSMTNTRSNLSSGTYRVYVEATVFAGSNSEFVTGWSSSVTIP